MDEREKAPLEQEFTPGEIDDIREIALYLRQYKEAYTIECILTWAVVEFLRRRYVREKKKRRAGV